MTSRRLTTSRETAEPVMHLLFHRSKFLILAQTGQPAVEIQPHVRVGHIARRQVSRMFTLIQDSPLMPLLTFQLRSGLLDHSDIELIADGRDVTRLREAEDVASAPDLEIMHGQLDPCPR